MEEGRERGVRGRFSPPVGGWWVRRGGRGGFPPLTGGNGWVPLKLPDVSETRIQDCPIQAARAGPA